MANLNFVQFLVALVIALVAGICTLLGTEQVFTGKKTYRDCQDVRNHGLTVSGVYTVRPFDQDVNLYCHMDKEGHMVMQRRYDGSVDFNRTWDEYRNGFGNLSKEHWLGNEQVHKITSQGNYELRIELEDVEGNVGYAVYSNFSFGDEASNYTLYIGSYSGTAGDSLSYHNKMMFSTKDGDNKHNCASLGAWWYNHCYHSNLNGLYSSKNKSGNVKYNLWIHWFKGEINMKSSTMMIKKRDSNETEDYYWLCNYLLSSFQKFCNSLIRRVSQTVSRVT